MMKRRRGLFITFEGPEGSGKSTQSRRLYGWLKRKGYPVLFTREPGGTAIGQRLRKILLDKHSKGITPFVELCLYEASRAILIAQVIRPALQSGRLVIVDRFHDSTWVYQGWAGEMDLRLTGEMNRTATRGLEPDLTIVLDLPVRQGLERVKRPNRMEAKPLAFHRKVRQGYLVLAQREPNRIRVIRADRFPGAVQNEIRGVVKDVLEKHRRS